MDFKFSAEDEAFRAELRSWLEANLPGGERGEHEGAFSDENPSHWQRRVAWHKKMHGGGWVGISWPKEYGGRGATLTQQLVYGEEMSRAHAPALVNQLGTMLVGPTLIQWGTEEQKKRYVPKILSADEIWCQGYSEPNSGSDVASLQTRAVEDVRVPKKNIVGEKNHGWQVAITTLMFERTGVGDPNMNTNQVLELARLAKLIRRNGASAWDDTSVRQRIAQFAAEAAALKYTGYRQITRRLKGRPPGPEGSVMKLGSSELHLRMAKFAMELLGPYSQFEHNAPFALGRGVWSYRMLGARAYTIAGGTSEIQHNIIGERVLGLPKG